MVDLRGRSRRRCRVLDHFSVDAETSPPKPVAAFQPWPGRAAWGCFHRPALLSASSWSLVDGVLTPALSSDIVYGRMKIDQIMDEKYSEQNSAPLCWKGLHDNLGLAFRRNLKRTQPARIVESPLLRCPMIAGQECQGCHCPGRATQGQAGFWTIPSL